MISVQNVPTTLHEHKTDLFDENSRAALDLRNFSFVPQSSTTFSHFLDKIEIYRFFFCFVQVEFPFLTSAGVRGRQKTKAANVFFRWWCKALKGISSGFIHV